MMYVKSLECSGHQRVDTLFRWSFGYVSSHMGLGGT